MGSGNSVALRTKIIENMSEENSIKLSDSAIQRLYDQKSTKSFSTNDKLQATSKSEIMSKKQATLENNIQELFDPNTINVPATRNDSPTPCENIRKNLIHCYDRNYKQTLQCRQEVKDFKQCCEMYQRTIINEINKPTLNKNV